MTEILKGWMAYILMNNSAATFIFIGMLIVIILLFWWMQSRKDEFDLRDIICEWNGKKQIVSTTKSLLAGSFLASSYYLIEHPSDMAFGAYLLAWVTNGGIAAWQKTQALNPVQGVLK